MPRLRSSKEIVVKPVRPNAGVTAQYQSWLLKRIRRMSDDVTKEVLAAYRERKPEIAQDASPANELQAILARLRQRWERGFARLAETQGRRFAESAAQATDRMYRASLRKAGFTVRFQPTRTSNDVFQATVSEQVGLIKSIPAEYLDRVQGMVMRSVQKGGDIGGLRKELEDSFGITRRRADTIARDQNEKATATFTRVRQQELGITHARWLHSGGGRHPRPEHVAFSGKVYEIKKGAFLEGKWTWPGVEINCRCVSLSIIPGLDDQ